MDREFFDDLTPEEAAFLRKTIRGLLREYRKRKPDIDPVTLAERLAEAINSGERDYQRIITLVPGAEAADDKPIN